MKPSGDTEPVPSEKPSESGQAEEINKNETENLDSTLQDDELADDSVNLKLDEESSEDEMQEELIEESLWEDVTGVAEEEHDVVYVPRKKPVIEKTEKEMDVDWQRQRLANRPPIILTNLTDRSVAIGSTVKLTCNVAGPEVTARWLKNDAEVERSQKLQYRASDGMQILEITNVDRKDVGVFTCVVKNKNGSLSTSAKVSVFDNLEDKPTTPVMVSIRGNNLFSVFVP